MQGNDGLHPRWQPPTLRVQYGHWGGDGSGRAGRLFGQVELLGADKSSDGLGRAAQKFGVARCRASQVVKLPQDFFHVGPQEDHLCYQTLNPVSEIDKCGEQEASRHYEQSRVKRLLKMAFQLARLNQGDT